MMPPPSHLTGCVVPDEETIDESNFAGRMQCPCGSQEMQLLHPEQTRDYQGEQIPCTAEIDGAFYFLIKAVCTKCGMDHTLFDKDFHGWDGFICHENDQASRPRPH